MRVRPVRLVALVAIVGVILGGVAQADTLEEIRDQLRDAERERERIEERIREAAVAYDELESRIADLEQEREELSDELEVLLVDLEELDELVSFRVRETFKHGQSLDPIAVFLGTDDPNAALSKAETVQRVVSADQARSEDLTAVRTAVTAAEQRLAEQAAELEDARREQRELTERLQQDFAEIQQLEERLTDEEREERERLERERREREERERREREAAAQREREREAAEREEAAEQQAAAQREAEREQTAATEESTSSGQQDTGSSSSDAAPEQTSSAPSGGGMACPLDQPRTFIDSWGHSRSGGRAHRGTDIMGPRGIPVRAITSGTWNIQSPGPSAGLWAILQGDNGDHYWYLHLDSHTVSNGARVNAGDQVGTNGATGNATAGGEHVHFELHPGGGSAVNPYSLLRSVCG